jgi:hypothetical protein
MQKVCDAAATLRLHEVHDDGKELIYHVTVKIFASAGELAGTAAIG